MGRRGKHKLIWQGCSQGGRVGGSLRTFMQKKQSGTQGEIQTRSKGKQFQSYFALAMGVTLRKSSLQSGSQFVHL